MKQTKLLIILIILTGCHSKNDIIIDKERIVGRWRLISPQDSQVEFTKTEELDYSYGKLMASFNYQIDNNDILTAIDKSSGEIYKWRIIKLTADSLVLSYLKRDYEQRFVKIEAKISN